MFEDLYGPPVPTRHLVVDWERNTKPKEVATAQTKERKECLSDLMARLKQR